MDHSNPQLNNRGRLCHLLILQGATLAYKGSLNTLLTFFVILISQRTCLYLPLLVLVTTALFPRGIIDFRKFEGPNLILAVYKGVANCTTMLEIKKDNRFIQRSICFGVDEFSGRYELKGDTITMYFDKKTNSVSRTAYGIIKLDSIRTADNIGLIMYYQDSLTSNRLPMRIIEYNMK